jgi:hypothetical protein
VSKKKKRHRRKSPAKTPKTQPSEIFLSGNGKLVLVVAKLPYKPARYSLSKRTISLSHRKDKIASYKIPKIMLKLWSKRRSILVVEWNKKSGRVLADTTAMKL